MELQDMMIYSRTLPERKAKYADYPKKLHPDLKAFLEQQGIMQVYCHQAEMFEEVTAGKNTVITTSTASGKTLSFLLPVIQTILENPLARAVFIYPTKALAADQMRALKPFLEYFGESRLNAGVYDGDTPPQERTRIRKSANLILTNPEMLNGSFLPNHSKYGFDFIFSNLKYVVIDELHSYRGVFGSHMANLFRRLNRVCSYYKSSPVFLCSSATIANPRELAENICGKPFVQVEKDGSPSAAKTYTLLQPPRVEGDDNHFEGQEQAANVAAAMIPDLVENGHSFIAFAQSRRDVEVILREGRDKLDAAGFLGHSDAGKIAGYRGGYTPLERKNIERKMISGELKGLVSTNALELGIDIGKVDTTVLVGFPGTRASFWQQTGRAGRSGKASNNYLILESRPRDQYIGVNPLWLFEGGSENAVIDRDNLLIELAHIRAAAAEIALRMDDIAVFPDLGECVPVLMKAGELRMEKGRFVWCGNAFPAGDFNMRGMDEKRYKLMDRETHKEITEMDELQAFHEIHEGAVYMHEGRQYQIVKMDTESRTAEAVHFEGNYYTVPGSHTEVSIVHALEEKQAGRTIGYWGDVNVDETVFMYKKLQFHNRQNLGWEKLGEQLSKDYDTESTWLRMPDNLVDVYRRLLQPDANGMPTRNNHFEGLMFAMKSAAMMLTMAEEGDLGASMSSNVIGTEGDANGDVYLYLYDKYVGGLGYSQKAYEHMGEIIDHAVELTAGCRCKDGCTACVGDYKLDKQVVLWGLRSLREELPEPASYKYVQYAKRPTRKKTFKYEELQEKWLEFTAFLAETGDPFANFLNTVNDILTERDILTLYLDNAFYRDWMMEPENYKGLRNIFLYHTDAPRTLKLRAGIKGTPDGSDPDGMHYRKIRKLQNRLKDRYSEEN